MSQTVQLCYNIIKRLHTEKGCKYTFLKQYLIEYQLLCLRVGEKAKDFTFSTILTNHFGKRNFLRRFG